MTVESTPDIVRTDPLFLEKQRNRYASRGVAFLVILNGVAALLLLTNFVYLRPQIENAPRLSDAMVVFGAGVIAALGSMFFAYLRRTIRLEAPERAPLIPVGWWLAVLAAVASAVCFLAGLRMVGTAVAPALVSAAHETALTWNQSFGGRGRGFCCGFSGYEVINNVQNGALQVGGDAELVATCSAGKKVLGGGYVVPSVLDTAPLSRPEPGNTAWRVGFHSNGGSGAISVYAICAFVN